jgi:hypothetical protein
VVDLGLKFSLKPVKKVDVTQTKLVEPERGEGGSYCPHVKTRPSDKRSPDIAPSRSDSNQKGYLFRPKTRPIKIML